MDERMQSPEESLVEFDNLTHVMQQLEVMDPRELTDELKEAAYALAGGPVRTESRLAMTGNGRVDPGLVSVRIDNPTPYPVDLSVTPTSADNRWSASPDHTHGVIPAGGTRYYDFRVSRPANSADAAMRGLDLAIDFDLRTEAFRYAIPTVTTPVLVDLSRVEVPSLGYDGALRTGDGAYAEVHSEAFDLPDGPFTLECWLKADSFSRRTGLIAKTESSEFGIFVSNGRSDFSVHLDGRYATARTNGPVLDTGRWTHVAGVYDGSEVRVYVDGVVVARRDAPAGERRRNDLPFMIGADVARGGEPTSFFDGLIDEVRLSVGAVYGGETFTPRRGLRSGPETVFLFTMDGRLGPWLPDRTGEVRATISPAADLVPAD